MASELNIHRDYEISARLEKDELMNSFPISSRILSSVQIHAKLDRYFGCFPSSWQVSTLLYDCFSQSSILGSYDCPDKIFILFFWGDRKNFSHNFL